MKRLVVAATSLLGLFASTVTLTLANFDQVSIRTDGVIFRVRRYTNQPTQPYRLVVKSSGTSTFFIELDGRLSTLNAGTEQYRVVYDTNGDILELRRTDSEGRMLLANYPHGDTSERRELSAEGVPAEAVSSDGHRRLDYACDDCEEAWDIVCSLALTYICELDGNDILGTNGAQAVGIACGDFGSLCNSLSADAVCAGRCVEVPTPAPTETDEVSCNPNPCLNGGVCTFDPAGGHICNCASGYGGMACQISTASLAEFYIELDFEGTWTADRTAAAQSAADRWAELITHVPCGGFPPLYPAGRLLVTLKLSSIDGPFGFVGFAGPILRWRQCPTISATGELTLDIDDVDSLEAAGIFELVVLHEMGHTIGIGANWGGCSTCFIDGDTNWKCPAVVKVYNDLLGNPGGTDSDVIEGGGVIGTACGHFDETIFGDEIMTGFVDPVMPISKVTAASLDDTAYIVDPSMVDDYILPAFRGVSSDVGGFRLADRVVNTTVGIIDEEDGEIEEEEGINMYF